MRKEKGACILPAVVVVVIWKLLACRPFTRQQALGPFAVRVSALGVMVLGWRWAPVQGHIRINAEGQHSNGVRTTAWPHTGITIGEEYSANIFNSYCQRAASNAENI